MPAVSQVGKLRGGGAFGLKQRNHAVTGARIANAIPYVAMAPPYTNGTFDSIAASLIRKRVSRLSVPSTTTSTPFRISRTVAEWTSLDRKSTRLNSSHSQISYAVFCLKKKKPLSSAARQQPSP